MRRSKERKRTALSQVIFFSDAVLKEKIETDTCLSGGGGDYLLETEFYFFAFARSSLG